MTRQYWLQYHNFEKEGCPGKWAINTNKDNFKSKLNRGNDIIYLIVGLEPKPFKLIECGISASILSTIDSQKRLYFIWEKFIAREWNYIGEKDFGGFDYEILGNGGHCYQDAPIILQSQEFKDFWNSYKLHGLICLSDYGCPFPELEQTGEGHKFHPKRRSQSGTLRIANRVMVSEDVYKGIVFIKKQFSRQQLSNLNEVEAKLRRYGHKMTADWITSHRKEYFAGWKVGFDLQSDTQE